MARVVVSVRVDEAVKADFDEFLIRLGQNRSAATEMLWEAMMENRVKPRSLRTVSALVKDPEAVERQGRLNAARQRGRKR